MLRLHQVGQAKQHTQSLRVLVQAPSSEPSQVGEVSLTRTGWVFNLRSHRRLLLLHSAHPQLSGSNRLRLLAPIATRHSTPNPAFSTRFSTPRYPASVQHAPLPAVEQHASASVRSCTFRRRTLSCCEPSPSPHPPRCAPSSRSATRFPSSTGASLGLAPSPCSSSDARTAAINVASMMVPSRNWRPLTLPDDG